MSLFPEKDTPIDLNVKAFVGRPGRYVNNVVLYFTICSLADKAGISVTFFPVASCVWSYRGTSGLVSVPDPNQPQHGSRDTGSDPRWGWFGSGTETSLARLFLCSLVPRPTREMRSWAW